jgi:hypothetical protein
MRRIVGDADRDTFIAGRTDSDAIDPAVSAILAEWISSRGECDAARDNVTDLQAAKFASIIDLLAGP